MHPKISIIIPVYNVEPYVGKCIESIKSQTLADFEAIIVDDGSTDSSIRICEELTREDIRFRIVHKKNGGLMSAWKYGLSHASGKFIGFVDSDDWIDSNMFEVLYDSIVITNADVIVSGYVTEGLNQNQRWCRDKQYIFEGNDIKEQFLKDYCCSYFHSISHPSINRWDKLYRKDILLNNLEFFNDKISLAEDFNTNIAVILDAKKIVLLQDFSPYHYRFNPKSIVNTFNPNAFNNISEIVKAWSKISQSKDYESIYIDSFIGNLLFEEINKICISVSKYSSQELFRNIDACNGFYYLNCYTKVRAKTIIKIWNWCIQHRAFSIIKILNEANKFRMSIKV